jgi:hypothetical protein
MINLRVIVGGLGSVCPKMTKLLASSGNFWGKYLDFYIATFHLVIL